MNFVRTRSLKRLSAAVGFSLLMATQGAMAGKIDNINNAPTVLGACGADGADSVACVGAWNLTNVQVDLLHSDGTTFGSFDSVTGAYTPMVAGDSFVSKIFNPTTTPPILTAKLYGKTWPVGEPTGIKAVNTDTKVKNGKPENCLINTSYLDAANSSTGNSAYLDTANPEPVICSSGFQTHKRFKVAMQPSTVDSTGGPVDLVFNVTDSSPTASYPNSIVPYQVFSKINNYTGKRLAGYKIEVGVGTGANFQTASELGINSELYLSLGKYEDSTSTSTPWGDLFTADGMATFSHGLFGPIDLPHFATEGFFSNAVAYYSVDQGCSATTNAAPSTCTATVTPDGVTSVQASDTIYSSGTLSTNYTNLFGAWLPSDWAPKGIFYDDDNNPSTDAKLVAWWNGTQWLYGQANGFAPVPAAQVAAWASDPLYSEDVIEDVLNLGINYIVHVGNINATSAPIGTNSYGGTNTFTVRIIPVVASDQTAPAWVGTTPTYFPTTGTATTSSGGGCTVGGDGRFDPTLPALLLAALGFVGWRRFSRKS